MELHISNETSQLEVVVLGIGSDIGKPIGINPLMRAHIKNNTYPKEKDIIREIKTFESLLKSKNIQVLRPENISETDQIFTRDIAFVIEDLFFVANMKYSEREPEIEGISHVIKEIDKSQIIEFPEKATIEAGDVILWNDYIFIGLGDRTNKKGLEFLKKTLKEKDIKKEVLAFDLNTDKNDYRKNILHLDCIFQPIGKDEAIIFEPGFKKTPEELLNLFPENKRIEVTQKEKDKMFPNIFSISPTEIVIERNFIRLKEELEKRNYTIYEVDYTETSKLCGLLRCSTLPLRREK